MGSDFVDEIDCSSFFDHMEDLIEFSPENDGSCLDAVDCKDFPSIWNDPLPDPDPLFSGSYSNSASDFSAEPPVPYEDIVQLEWLSMFVEDSFSCGGLTLGKEHCPVKKEEPSDSKFLIPSSVSVLESSTTSSSSSSSSSSSGPGKTLPPRGPQRARSKRPRPTTFNPRPVNHLMLPTSVIPQQLIAPGVNSSASENFAESPMKKKKKIKFSIPQAPIETNQDNNYQPAPQAVRKCLHCEITKTPQWRAGPMGPKTLCNACGVRYKKGRLYPECRPAASPTFVPSLHSNSHKKVLEMRSNILHEEDTHNKQAKPRQARPPIVGQDEKNTTTASTTPPTVQLDLNPE